MLVTPPSAYAQGFHTKAFVWKGIYVLGNNQMADEAVLRAAEIVFNSMATMSSGLLAKLVQHTARFAVVPFERKITDLPDYDDLSPAVYGDTRGLGAVIGRPTSAAGEENIVPSHPNDPYNHQMSIALHEWLHAIEGIALKAGNPTLHNQFKAAYTSAMNASKWGNTYAATNFYEYFAMTGQAFFDNLPDIPGPNGTSNHINTRAELASYDPTVYNLFVQLFGTPTWTVGQYYGSDSTDTLNGTSKSNLIFGNGGDDTVDGKGGNDNLLGGDGKDTIEGGAGTDLLEGGNHDDTFRIYAGQVASGEVYDGGTGIDTLGLGHSAAAGSTYSIDLRPVTLRSIDAITLFDPGFNLSTAVLLNAAQIGGTALAATGTVTGVSFDDVADRFEVTMGTKSSVSLAKLNFVDFTGSKDRIVVLGDTTAETITGSKLADSINSGGGNDVLNGGLGRDTLNGGTGADKFVFKSALVVGNIDVVPNFTPGSDLIQLDDAIFQGIGSALSTAEFYKAAGAIAAHDSTDRIIYNTTNGRLYLDIDGINGVAAVYFATLSGKPAIGAGDFDMI
jgi:serralysin